MKKDRWALKNHIIPTFMEAGEAACTGIALSLNPDAGYLGYAAIIYSFVDFYCIRTA